MSLPDQLRAIADRLEAAEAEKAAALDELWQIHTVDSAAVLVAAGAGAEASRPSATGPSAPIQGEATAVRDDPVSREAGRPQGSPPEVSGSPLPIEQAGSGPTIQASGRLDSGRPSTVPPGANTCPECGKTTPTPAGLVTHRSRVHHIKVRPTPAQRLSDRKKVPTNGDSRPFSAPIGKAAIPPEPVIRHGKEAWLCNRCTQSFESRERLTAHMQKGHPPVGTAPTRPFGEQPIAEYAAGGGFRD